MLLTLVVVVFAVVIVGSLIDKGAFGKTVAAKEHQNQQAYYVAETGLYNVLQRNDLVSPEGALVQTFYSGPTTDERSELVDWQDDWEYSVVITPLGASTYSVDSTGRTAYSQAMASARVRITALGSSVTSGSLHFGPTTGPLNVSQTVTSDAQGNRIGVLYHIDGSDANVYGKLQLGPGHDATTFNIWGYTEGGQPHKFQTTDDTGDFVGQYPWLLYKHEQWDPAGFPNLADSAYQALMRDLMPGPYTVITESSNKVYSVWGPGGQSDPIKATILPLPSREAILPGTTLMGCGLLNIAAEQESYRISRLELTGDLTIIVDGDFVLQQDVALVSHGYKLIVIAPEHSVTFSSNANGDYNPSWSPFTGDNENQNRFYLGDGSVLWAKNHVTIEGVLMPYSHPAGDNFREVLSWVDEATKSEIADDDWDRQYVGSMGLFSRDGSVKFNTVKTRGVLYAGGTLLGYRLRLHGVAAFRHPYRPDSETLGLAQCYITGTVEDGFDDLDLPAYEQEILARTR